MNMDDFEKQLERQDLRQPPEAWRNQILAAARAHIGAGTSADESSLLAGWRAWLARIPLAWGAVAAIWLVIVGANMLMSGPVATGPSAPAGHEAMTVWNLQRAEFGLLANELTDVMDVAPARKPVPPTRPHSERQQDNGFGELFPTPITAQTLIVAAGPTTSIGAHRPFEVNQRYET